MKRQIGFDAPGMVYKRFDLFPNKIDTNQCSQHISNGIVACCGGFTGNNKYNEGCNYESEIHVNPGGMSDGNRVVGSITVHVCNIGFFLIGRAVGLRPKFTYEGNRRKLYYKFDLQVNIKVVFLHSQ